jgi:subtilisin-like proprotein convertase family protein
MKTIKLTLIAVTMLVTALAQGQVTVGFTNTVNATVPDANPNGMAVSQNLSGVIGSVSSVTVALDITGGFNGDLYAYLVDPSGDISILLNRVGVTAVGGNNYFGYGDSGFNIVLSDGSSNIHNYQSDSPTIVGGQLTGTWAPDGRNIDPQSAPSVFDSAATTADMSVFNSMVPNGQWTLFIADLSAGGTSTLVSWGLTVVTVPEPQTWAMVAGGLGMLALRRRAR